MPARKNAPTRSRNKKPPTSQEPSVTTLRSHKQSPMRPYTAITIEERARKISQEAYYRAEQRGFHPDGQIQDWLEAEAKIDAQYMQSDNH